MADDVIVSQGYEHAIRVRTEQLNRALQDLQYRAWKGANDFVHAGQRYVADPVSLLRDAGNFAADVVRDTARRARELYGAGVTAYNTILSILDTPCEDKWTVIIETALPPAGQALLVLLTPSPGEILEEYLTPKGLLAGKCGFPSSSTRRRKRGLDGKSKLSLPSIPDTDGMIAGWLPGQQIAEDLGQYRGYRLAFTGIQIQDLVGWTWLLLDVTRDFFINWSSGMVTTRFCSRPFSAIAEIVYSSMTGIGSVGWLADRTGSITRLKGPLQAVPRGIDAATYRGVWPLLRGTAFLRVSGTVRTNEMSRIRFRLIFRLNRYGKAPEERVIYSGDLKDGDSFNAAYSTSVDGVSGVEWYMDEHYYQGWGGYNVAFHGGMFAFYGEVILP